MTGIFNFNENWGREICPPIKSVEIKGQTLPQFHWESVSTPSPCLFLSCESESLQPLGRGFTLIEIMVVIAIMALVLGLAYPQYQVMSRSNLRESSRQMAGAIHYLYSRAALDKKPWRLAMDFKESKYWGERLTETGEISPEAQKKTDNSWVKAESITNNQYTLYAPGATSEKRITQYLKTTTAVLKETRLPKGVIFRDMRVVGRDQVTGGLSYIYFSPYGGVERAVIHLKHEDHNWVYTIVTKPLSGRVAVFDTDRDIEQIPILGPVRE